MYRFILLLCLSLPFFIACDKKEPSTTSTTDTTTQVNEPDSIKDYKRNALSNTQIDIQDKLFKKIMFVHDDVMPLMGEMNKISRTLRKAATGNQLDLNEQEAAQGVARQLDNAGEAMMDWMARVGENSLGKLRDSLDHAQIMGVLDQQMAEIMQVNKDMKSSLQSGRGMIQKLNLK